MRAPEELAFKSSQYLKRNIRLDKTDVWGLGNTLYNVLTNKWVYEGISNQQAVSKILRGQYHYNSFHGVDDDHSLLRAIQKAVEMAWTFKPEDRPSARLIAKFLKRQYQTYTKGDVSTWRVSVPPLPKNYSHTDKDFMSNLGVVG